MSSAEPENKLEREDTVLSEAPSTSGTKLKKSKSRISSPTPSQPKTPESRPRSSSSDVFVDGKKKKKQAPLPPGAHKVTFTVTIAKAFPNASEEDSSVGGDPIKKKKRIVEAPRAQNHYHCEYFLLPDDDDPVKTDIVTFGMAAKIYTERQEPKVLKTWQTNDQSWVAWVHCHPVIVTDEVLMKLFNHKLEMRVWDTRDKLSTRAKFDRPKAFRLPQPKPGEDADNVGGVKTLVMKQSKSYESMQPKRSYINRPLPSQIKVTDKDIVINDVAEKSRLHKLQSRNLTKKPSPENKNAGPEENVGPVQTPAVQPPTQDGQPLKSYGHLAGLVGKDPVEERRENTGEGAGRGRSNYINDGWRKHVLPSLPPPRPDLNMPPPTGDSDSSMDRMLPKGTSKARRNRKAEAQAQAIAEQTKKSGIACISIRMATLFSGVQTITGRLEKPLPNLDDVFVTVSLNAPLMSEEQKQKLNPLIIKVHSARQMPETPLCYADLRLRCQPAYVKYRFFNQPEYFSCGREQDESIYWDDVNVVLTGTLDKSELMAYLSGPPLEVEVHDRDRVLEKQKLKPTLFGDDLEDQKISNVGTVTSKRTIHNPFSSRDRPWDPYGLCKFDLSGLLLGQCLLHLEAPIHSCPNPDILGTRGTSADDKLVGIAGATDGPVETPLPAGHYMESNSILKIRIELAYPFVTQEEISKEEVHISPKCPFSRIVFMFAYKNTKVLNKLQNQIMAINAKALNLQEMPQHVIEAALSTYKLSLDQQQNATLDIVTGFQVLDGTQHIFVLEGLRDGAIKDLWESNAKDKTNGISVLYNSALSFHERLYGPLDVDLCRVKLHEPLTVIMQQPLLYVRDMVPQPCFNALSKLNQLVTMSLLRDVVRNDLFPSADMVISMSREFGVPLTTEDFEELQHEEERVSESPVAFVEATRTSRQWTPIDHFNSEFNERMQDRDTTTESKDYITDNKFDVKMKSADNKAERAKTSPATIRADTCHNYSTQTLNSTDQAKEKLRELLAEKDPESRYTYCPDYHHSMTVVPVNVEALNKEAREESVSRWRTPAGWIFPGKKTSIESNKHKKKPDPAKIDEVHTEWVENILHANVLEPTLEREGFMWKERQSDFDVWTKPNPIFGVHDPATIHLAGSKLKDEKMEALLREQKEWQSKLVVHDPEMKFHRCLPETETRFAGFKSSNQLDRLEGLLKDVPNKLYLRNARTMLGEIPPLNVVLNPSVDRPAREAGLPVLPPVPSDDNTRGFVPGPFNDHSWLLDRNKIPVYDYNHHKFIGQKGHDFRLYHKPRTSLHNRKIVPLSDGEYQGSLFRWPTEKTTVPPYTMPDVQEFKKAIYGNTLDSNLTMDIPKVASPQKAVETN